MGVHGFDSLARSLLLGASSRQSLVRGLGAAVALSLGHDRFRRHNLAFFVLHCLAHLQQGTTLFQQVLALLNWEQYLATARLHAMFSPLHVLPSLVLVVPERSIPPRRTPASARITPRRLGWVTAKYLLVGSEREARARANWSNASVVAMIPLLRGRDCAATLRHA
jgi:hypothetical protein